MDKKEWWQILHMGSRCSIRAGRGEGPELRKPGKPRTARMSMSISLNRKRSFARLFYFDAHYDQTLSDWTSTMLG